MRRPWETSLLVGIVAILLAACQTVPQVPGTLGSNAIPSSNAEALPVASTPMPQGLPERDPPPGFVSFCMRFGDQCSSPTSEPAVLQLNPQTWSELAAVNSSVNAAIWPEDDKRHYGSGEFWTIPTDGYGDCEDYALTKRKLLANAGIPKRALRMAVVVTQRNNRHAVLTVATDQGDYVLDNESDDIQPWYKTGYNWISRQDTKNDWGWVALNDTPMQIATATAVSETLKK